MATLALASMCAFIMPENGNCAEKTRLRTAKAQSPSTAEKAAQTTARAAPAPAPDRRLRLNRPLPDQSQPESLEGTSDQNSKAGATTVSLSGAVTRLDGSASAAGEQRPPLTGKVDSIIPTLSEGVPRSESIPPATFRGWLESTHPKFALSAQNTPEDSVVVIKGQWDNSSKTLTKLQIPHTRIGGGKVAAFPFESTKVVIVDCPGDLPRAACQKLRNFVIRGGYLLSTDWALDNFTGPVFNDYIQWNKGMNRRDIVDATVSDTDPVLFARTVSNAHWKLDQDSHLIHVVNRDAVRILAQSRELVQDDPDKAGILAVMFPFGRGYVLHMTGHFDNNSKLPLSNFLPDPAPVIKISLRQALATNFVVAGLTQTPIATNHRK